MPGNDIRLLALDGGGIRGLSTLIILQQLMEAIDREHPPKPCDYFDMIGGTSTGGYVMARISPEGIHKLTLARLIAIMLGRLKMSVNDCIDAYISLSDRIFQKSKHLVMVDGSIRDRFDSGELTRAVKEFLRAQGISEDTSLNDVSENACKV